MRRAAVHPEPRRLRRGPECPPHGRLPNAEQPAGRPRGLTLFTKAAGQLEPLALQLPRPADAPTRSTKAVRPRDRDLGRPDQLESHVDADARLRTGTPEVGAPVEGHDRLVAARRGTPRVSPPDLRVF